MGTPSRVKGGLQEMRTVVELTGVTARLLTDSNRPACGIRVNDMLYHTYDHTYLVPAVVLDHFHFLIMEAV